MGGDTSEPEILRENLGTAPSAFKSGTSATVIVTPTRVIYPNGVVLLSSTTGASVRQVAGQHATFAVAALVGLLMVTGSILPFLGLVLCGAGLLGLLLGFLSRRKYAVVLNTNGGSVEPAQTTDQQAALRIVDAVNRQIGR